MDNIAENENCDWIEELVCYTNKQQYIIDHIYDFVGPKHILNKIFAKGEMARFTTKNGIQEQLEEFSLPIGIIFFVAFCDNKPVVVSKQIKLKSPYSLKEIF